MWWYLWPYVDQACDILPMNLMILAKHVIIILLLMNLILYWQSMWYYITHEYDIILAKDVILYWPSMWYEYDTILAKHVILYWMDGYIILAKDVILYWPSMWYEYDTILAKHVILYWMDGYYIGQACNILPMIHDYDIILAKHVIWIWYYIGQAYDMQLLPTLIGLQFFSLLKTRSTSSWWGGGNSKGWFTIWRYNLYRSYFT